MNTYLIMPERCNWLVVEATSHESAYRQTSHWYGITKQIAVMDKTIGLTKIYRQRIDKDGNLIEVTEV